MTKRLVCEVDFDPINGTPQTLEKVLLDEFKEGKVFNAIEINVKTLTKEGEAYHVTRIVELSSVFPESEMTDGMVTYDVFKTRSWIIVTCVFMQLNIGISELITLH